MEVIGNILCDYSYKLLQTTVAISTPSKQRGPEPEQTLTLQ